MKEIEQMLALLLLDMLHSDLLKEGYAINGSGVAIDMEEIKKERGWEYKMVNGKVVKVDLQGKPVKEDE